jgi:hypothetical protein
VWFISELPQNARGVLQVVADVLQHLREVKGVVAEAWTHEGEQLICVVARHLIACYRSTKPNFSLAPTLTDVNKEAKDDAKEHLYVETTITRITPRFCGLSCVYRSHTPCTAAP